MRKQCYHQFRNCNTKKLNDGGNLMKGNQINYRLSKICGQYIHNLQM